MRALDSWTAFLVMLFAIVGLCGLFASYSTSIPLERGVARSTMLDEALKVGAGADGPQRLDAMRPQLGSLGELVVDGLGSLPDRVAQARRIVVDEQQREAASIAYRTRLMLGVVTLIAAVLGAGIMAIARRQAIGGDQQAP